MPDPFEPVPAWYGGKTGALKRILVDPAHVGLIAHSLGGNVAEIMLAVQPGIRTAVLYAPSESEYSTLYLRRPGFFAGRPGLGTPSRDAALYRAMSPGSNFGTLHCTVLLEHGTADRVVPARASEVTTRELSAAGINFNFAPVMDVVPPGTDAQNQPIGALQREYGHDPATAGSHGVAFLAGMHQSGVAVSLKHYPGLGRVAGNTDFTTATDTMTTMNDPYLQSFAQGIAANADFVMVALARYTQIDPAHLAAFSSVVMTQTLRGTMGFNGVIISDDLGDTVAVASIPPATRAIDFLSAGGDMIISKTSAPAHAMVLAIRSRAAADPTFRQRVDDAAFRILRAKQSRGLLPC